MAIEQVNLDIDGWTQDQVNWTKSAVSQILGDAGIAHGRIRARNGVVRVTDPTSPIATVVNSGSVLGQVLLFEAVKVQKNAEALIESQARDAIVNASVFKNMTTKQADEYLNAISSLEQVIVVMKDLIRYLVSRGV